MLFRTSKNDEHLAGAKPKRGRFYSQPDKWPLVYLCLKTIIRPESELGSLSCFGWVGFHGLGVRPQQGLLGLFSILPLELTQLFVRTN